MTDKEQMPLVPQEWEAEGGKPMSIDKAKAEFDIGYPHVPAEELKGESFVIRGARQFESDLNPERNPYFVLCADAENGELFTTTLGGKQPVEFLEAYMAKGGKRPLAVTLTWVDKGPNKSYYVIV